MSREKNALIAKNEIDNSVQMQYLRELSITEGLVLRNLRAPTFFALHASTKANLHVDKKTVMTEFANSVKEKPFYEIIIKYIKDNCSGNYIDDMMHYAETKLGLSLSPFNPVIHIDQIVNYGINKGKWTDIIKRDFSNYFKSYLSKIKWTKEDIFDIPEGITRWDELILAQPMMAILRHDATSAYPYYKKQVPNFILKTYYEALHNPLNGYVTAYHRRHGYSKVFDEASQIYRLIEKDRFVGGVEFGSKLRGLPLTYSFQQSAPEFTPYYKDWMIVFPALLKLYKDLHSKFIFTTDQSRFDQLHNTYLTRDMFNEIISTMPDNMIRPTKEFVENDYNNPRIIMNARYFIRLGRWLSISGSPGTPLLETLNNLAMHDYLLEKQKIERDVLLVQIDDAFCIADKPVDLQQFSKDAFSDLGFITNPDKTETNEKGHITYLQVNLGKIFREDLPTVSDLTWEDGIGFLGHVLRRVHRYFKKERLRQVIGDVLFMRVDENDKEVGIDVPAARFMGATGSLGPMCPEELLNIILDRFKDAYYYVGNKKVNLLDYCIEYAKSKFIISVGEYGFDMKFLLEKLREL